MHKITYETLSGLEHVYLEDSYLLDLEENESRISFIVEAVLTPKHYLYKKPKFNEHHCYQKIQIVFDSVKNVDWIKNNLKLVPSMLDTIPDYGNIDAFYKAERKFHVEGEWGIIEFEANDPAVEIL